MTSPPRAVRPPPPPRRPQHAPCLRGPAVAGAHPGSARVSPGAVATGGCVGVCAAAAESGARGARRSRRSALSARGYAACAAHRATEEGNCRLEHAATRHASRHVECLRLLGRELEVAVGTQLPRDSGIHARSPLGVRRAEPVLQRAPLAHGPTAQALDQSNPAVQVEHSGLAGSRVQPVDILRDDAGADVTELFETDERVVRRIGLRPRKILPPCKADKDVARPVRLDCICGWAVGVQGRRCRACARVQKYHTAAYPRSCAPSSGGATTRASQSRRAVSACGPLSRIRAASGSRECRCAWKCRRQ